VLEWKVSCAPIVPPHKEEKSKDIMEGDGGPSNPMHVQTLETSATRRCLDIPLRNSEDHGENGGGIGHIHILVVMPLSPHTPYAENQEIIGKVLCYCIIISGHTRIHRSTKEFRLMASSHESRNRRSLTRGMFF